MTPDQDAKLEETRNKVNEVWDILREGHHAQNPRWIFDELEAIKAAIKPGGASLTPAQAQQLAHIESMLVVGLKGS